MIRELRVKVLHVEGWGVGFGVEGEGLGVEGQVGIEGWELRKGFGLRFKRCIEGHGGGCTKWVCGLKVQVYFGIILEFS